LFLMLAVFFTGCMGSAPETKYVCSDGSIVSNKHNCEQVERYVCLNGKLVEDPADCPKPKSSTTLVTKYICPDGRVVEEYSDCGITSTTIKETKISSSTTTQPKSGIRLVGLSLADEWVQLFNGGNSKADLSGWFLRDEEDHTFIFPDGFMLYPNSSARVHTGDGLNTPSDLFWGRDDDVWNNDGDTASLWDSELNLIDKLSVGVREESTTTSTSTTTSLTTINVSTSTIISTSTSSTTSSSSTTTSISTTTSSTVPAGSVLLTEVMYDLPGIDDGREWVEVYAVDVSVDLGNWRLEEERLNGDKTQHLLKEYQGGLVLDPGVYAVIADDPSAFLSDYPTYGGILIDSSFDLLNSGLNLRLLDGRDGGEIDHIFYLSAEMGAAGNGFTLVRDGDSMVEGSDEGGSPGEPNT